MTCYGLAAVCLLRSEPSLRLNHGDHSTFNLGAVITDCDGFARYVRGDFCCCKASSFVRCHVMHAAITDILNVICRGSSVLPQDHLCMRLPFKRLAKHGLVNLPGSADQTATLQAVIAITICSLMCAGAEVQAVRSPGKLLQGSDQISSSFKWLYWCQLATQGLL